MKYDFNESNDSTESTVSTKLFEPTVSSALQAIHDFMSVEDF